MPEYISVIMQYKVDRTNTFKDFKECTFKEGIILDAVRPSWTKVRALDAIEGVRWFWVVVISSLNRDLVVTFYEYCVNLSIHGRRIFDPGGDSNFQYKSYSLIGDQHHIFIDSSLINMKVCNRFQNRLLILVYSYFFYNISIQL